jgi:hypothetical protein
MTVKHFYNINIGTCYDLATCSYIDITNIFLCLMVIYLLILRCLDVGKIQLYYLFGAYEPYDTFLQHKRFYFIEVIGHVVLS